MSIAAKLWDRVMDQMLERHTGHKFGSRPFRRHDPYGVLCRNLGCNCNCLDVMEAFKRGQVEWCVGCVQPDVVVKVKPAEEGNRDE